MLKIRFEELYLGSSSTYKINKARRAKSPFCNLCWRGREEKEAICDSNFLLEAS